MEIYITSSTTRSARSHAPVSGAAAFSSSELEEESVRVDRRGSACTPAAALRAPPAPSASACNGAPVPPLHAVPPPPPPPPPPWPAPASPPRSSSRHAAWAGCAGSAAAGVGSRPKLENSSALQISRKRPSSLSEWTRAACDGSSRLGSQVKPRLSSPTKATPSSCIHLGGARSEIGGRLGVVHPSGGGEKGDWGGDWGRPFPTGAPLFCRRCGALVHKADVVAQGGDGGGAEVRRHSHHGDRREGARPAVGGHLQQKQARQPRAARAVLDNLFHLLALAPARRKQKQQGTASLGEWSTSGRVGRVGGRGSPSWGHACASVGKPLLYYTNSPMM
eukprot:scaffold22609_cov101-Isochrysis_galbana.AAC.2